MTYINRTQWTQLLAPIKPERVQITNRQSNVAAYDVRAHLNRVFGFGRWSGDVVDCTMIYDYDSDLSSGQPGKAVAYRVTYRLTVNAPDGTVLATYTETAVGAQKMGVPSHGDCHDFAIKTAESQAFKRCAINLGDQFGLSLYLGGSTAALVGGTIVSPDPVGPAAAGPHPDAPHEDVTAHITEQLPSEDSPAGPAEQAEPSAAPTRQGTGGTDWSLIIRNRVVDEAPTKPANGRKAFLARQLIAAGQHGVGDSLVADESDGYVPLKDLIQTALRAAA